MSMRTPIYARLLVELFKLLRCEWKTRREVAQDLDITDQTAKSWLMELVASGMLETRQDTKVRKRGRAPAQYTVAAAWGGQAC